MINIKLFHSCKGLMLGKLVNWAMKILLSMAVTDMDVYIQDYSIPYLLQKLILGIRKKNAPYLVTRQYLIGLLRFSGLRGMPFMGKLLHSFSRVSRRKEVGFWMCSETNQIRTLLVSCAFHLWHLNMLRWSYYHFKI